MSRLPPRKLAIGVCAIGVLSLASCRSMVHRCEPREIPLAQRTVSPALVAATRDEQIERGKPRPVIDGLGWFFGIPGKIVLWDRRVENHDISAVTELAISDYLDDNQLDHVKVRLNQYAPLDDFRRLTKNKTVGWPYRYTIGALSVAGEAVFPGRLFGGDHYNPFTATVHLSSDVPAIALHEGGHAKDFTRRKFPGTYALVAGLPVVDLWPEALATGDVLAYAEKQPDGELEQEACRILYPAYGTSIGGAAGNLAGMTIGLPVYAGAVVAGHVAGRKQARTVADEDAQEVSVDANVADTMAPDADQAADGKTGPAAPCTTFKRLAKTPQSPSGPSEDEPGTR